MYKRHFQHWSKAAGWYYSSTFNRVNRRRDVISVKELFTDRKKRKYVAVGVGGASLFYVANLDQAPISGRSRFLWLPRSWEILLGEYSYNSMLLETQGKLFRPDHPLTAKVNRVFKEILRAAMEDPRIETSLLSGLDWKIHVVYDPHAPPNAMVMPGGKVFIFSNMFDICRNDDGLAAVLSHELSHQLARHTAENISKSVIYSILLMSLYSLTGVHSLNDLLLDGLLRKPASREMETEADYIGLMVMARACYNPNESIRLWKRMSDFEKNYAGERSWSSEFLSTHPSSEKRIENMKKWMPEAREIYNSSSCTMFGSYYDAFRAVIG